MKPLDSLKKNHQFRVVYNKGKSIANKYIVVYLFKNKQKINRLGITVSKKVGNSVVRSRVTRLIRESVRTSGLPLEVGFDIIVLARPTAKDASFLEIKKSVCSLFSKHGLVKDTKNEVCIDSNSKIISEDTVKTQTTDM